MGLIKTPEGVDFVIESEPLTDKERVDISKFIKASKLKIEKRSKKLKSKKEII